MDFSLCGDIYDNVIVLSMDASKLYCQYKVIFVFFIMLEFKNIRIRLFLMAFLLIYWFLRKHFKEIEYINVVINILKIDLVTSLDFIKKSFVFDFFLKILKCLKISRKSLDSRDLPKWTSWRAKYNAKCT